MNVERALLKLNKLKSEINELNFQIMHTQKNINLENSSSYL